MRWSSSRVLTALPAAGEGARQIGGVEARAQRLGAQAGEPGVAGQRVGGDQVHVAEAARVEDR